MTLWRNSTFNKQFESFWNYPVSAQNSIDDHELYWKLKIRFCFRLTGPISYWPSTCALAGGVFIWLFQCLYRNREGLIHTVQESPSYDLCLRPFLVEPEFSFDCLSWEIVKPLLLAISENQKYKILISSFKRADHTLFLLTLIWTCLSGCMTKSTSWNTDDIYIHH